MNTALKKNIEEVFITTFSNKPSLYFSPGRINLIGEHTDYNNGFVFPAAINKGIYLALEKNDAKQSTIVSLDKKETLVLDASKTQTKQSGFWQNYIIGVIAEIQKTGIAVPNFNAVFGGDIPLGAGLSSSAALENAFAFGLNSIFSLGLSKSELIFISQKAEHNFVGVQCGIMDQYASMFGKKDTALLLDCKSLKAKPFQIDFGAYQILLINSNVTHTLTNSAYNKRREVCEKAAAMRNKESLREMNTIDLEALQTQLSASDFNKVNFIFEENDRVLTAGKQIAAQSLTVLGELLYKSHQGLSQLYEVSCSELDFLVEETKTNDNILGARMMGGGFGGCTINLIHTDDVERFKHQIQKKYFLSFQKECSFYSVSLSKGTHKIEAS